jgi:RimJ/RimL family protein N-acetyltransferase
MALPGDAGGPGLDLSSSQMSTSPTCPQRCTPCDGHGASAEVLAAANGGQFWLRPLSVSDREALRTLFARLSPESRRRRFFTLKPHLSARELTYFTDIDHVRHEAIAAIDLEDGSLIGVARYVMWPERAGAAEVAIEVADDFQSNGVGLMLAEALIRRARENDINLLTATTLWENHAARALARRVGFRARSSGAHEIELERPLDETFVGDVRNRPAVTPEQIAGSHPDSEAHDKTLGETP